MTKFRISLPEDLAEAVSLRYPDSPFSTAVAKILRNGLDIEPPPCADLPGPSHPVLAEMIRDIVIKELEKGRYIGDPDDVSEPIEISFPIYVQDSEWLTSGQEGALLPGTLPRGKKSSAVCRTIAQGILETNKLDGRDRWIL